MIDTNVIQICLKTYVLSWEIQKKYIFKTIKKEKGNKNDKCLAKLTKRDRED